MPGFRRREREETSVEDERELLRRQRVEAAEELARLKQELAERVAAVRDKERMLEESLGRAGIAAAAPPPGPPGEREQTVVGEEAGRVEQRLAELREAERVFLRTQEELASRSEALSARERLVAERERELDEREHGAGLGPTRSELSELESRLRRLESRGPLSSEDTQSFAAGLEGLRRRGTKRPPAG